MMSSGQAAQCFDNSILTGINNCFLSHFCVGIQVATNSIPFFLELSDMFLFETRLLLMHLEYKLCAKL
jgi:hypothetical protein